MALCRASQTLSLVAPRGRVGWRLDNVSLGPGGTAALRKHSLLVVSDLRAEATLDAWRRSLEGSVLLQSG